MKWLLALMAANARMVNLFGGHGHWYVACALVDSSIPMYLWVALIRHGVINNNKKENIKLGGEWSRVTRSI